MYQLSRHVVRRSLTAVVAAALVAGCAEDSPLTPSRQAALPAHAAIVPESAAEGEALATLQRVTARYQDLHVALDEDFVLLEGCESRPGEGPAGAVYVHFGRLLDGVIDPELPDALIYEPARNGRSRLVGVEFAVPYALWTQPAPPTFLGTAFQPEDEFGVWALHAWVWLHNPEGMFAETNPRVTCGIL